MIDFCNNALVIDSSIFARYTSYRTVYGAAHEILHARARIQKVGLNSGKVFFT